jgi:hypothetical protein
VNRDEIYEVEAILKSLATSNVHIKHREEIDRLLEIIEPLAERERAAEYTQEMMEVKCTWDSWNPIKRVQDVICVLTEAAAYHQAAKKEEVSLEKETQDMLHALEITELSDKEKISLANDLGEIRRKRRGTKDFMELITPLLTFSENNKGLINELESIQSHMKETVKGWETRTYKVRKRTSLQSAFDRMKGIDKKTSLQLALEKAEIS